MASNSEPHVLKRLPLLFRVALWWSRYGPRKGRWAVWELACRRAGQGRAFDVVLDCGATVRASLCDPISRYPIAYGGMYEPVLKRELRAALSPGTVFVDVGANFGYYMLLGALAVGPSGRVYAFEPQPTVCADLRRNVQLNELQNVEVHATALGDEPGLATMYVARGGQSGTASLSAEAAGEGGSQLDEITVPVDTLDRLFPDPEPRIDVIKMDVEGHELAALAGATSVLRTHRPKLFCEVSPESAPTAHQRLAGLGYALYRLTAGGLVAAKPEDLSEIGTLVALPDEASPHQC